jgi:hypothetical protein
MTHNERRRIGLPWYSSEDYPSIRELMDDRHNLAATYDQWLSAAENNERVGQEAGLEIVRVMIEPAAFVRWCDENGRTPDNAARVDYVAERAARQSSAT